MRVLPGVERVSFDTPSETFTIHVRVDVGPGSILAAIHKLGFEPERLAGAPATAQRLERLAEPVSKRLQQALAQAAEQDKPLVLCFGAGWCSLCKKFAVTTLKDERVRAELNTHSVFLHLDVDADPEAAIDLGVAGIPDLWVLAPDGRVLARENRYLDAEAFLALLRPFRR